MSDAINTCNIIVKFAANNDIPFLVFHKTAGSAIKMLKYLKAKTALSNIAYRQRVAHHAFLAAARTSTVVRVRDKATSFEAFPPPASPGRLRSQQFEEVLFTK